MEKKILVIAILGMFLLTSLTTLLAVGMKSAGGNTIYVDDDNTEGPWDGTQEHPFQKIKDGVYAASEGDTVFVYNGDYCEYKLTIGKTINLIGESKENTYLTGKTANTVINLPCSANGTTISGFTIENTGTEWDGDGISIGPTSCSHEIYDNILKGNFRAIYSVGKSDLDKVNKIHNNLFINNHKAFHLCFPASNEIYSNIFIEVPFVLDFGSGYESMHCLIYRNNFLTSDFVVDRGNTWDKDGVGNYWGTYYDIDENQDGIWDNPKKVSDYANDHFPATKAFLESNPPDAGLLDGSSIGNVGTRYIFNFSATDPDGDDIKYYFDFSDGNTEWTDLLDSGKLKQVTHYYDKKGVYLIRAKARDIWGYESGWALLEVTMPRDRAINTPFLSFLENHPILFQLFQRLLKI